MWLDGNTLDNKGIPWISIFYYGTYTFPYSIILFMVSLNYFFWRKFSQKFLCSIIFILENTGVLSFITSLKENSSIFISSPRALPKIISSNIVAFFISFSNSKTNSFDAPSASTISETLSRGVSNSLFLKSWTFLKSSRSCPSFLRSAVIFVSSKTTPDSIFEVTIFLTLTSSIISSLNTSSLLFIVSDTNGCRILIPALALSAKESSTKRRVFPIFSIIFWSTFPAFGHASRCTLSLSFNPFTFWYISSAKNGIDGAINLENSKRTY